MAIELRRLGILVSFAGAALIGSANASASEDAGDGETSGPIAFLKTHCLNCHGEEKQHDDRTKIWIQYSPKPCLSEPLRQ
ncbi:hypothetical protein Mal15_65350 [Stieleria maiorica]|uniref:Cytochrome C Planctomycete-type domain-containing protein n=1 Tax=Stieleria maiorica TaxID=2795974 RepID=A0A5B9MN88_9BACT|nr:hypothetical protein Mal15_65350 [Stieleria maiorica]